jgi:hypothetical protein
MKGATDAFVTIFFEKFPYKWVPFFDFTPGAHYTGRKILFWPREQNTLVTPLVLVF